MLASFQTRPYSSKHDTIADCGWLRALPPPCITAMCHHPEALLWERRASCVWFGDLVRGVWCHVTSYLLHRASTLQQTVNDANQQHGTVLRVCWLSCAPWNDEYKELLIALNTKSALSFLLWENPGNLVLFLVSLDPFDIVHSWLTTLIKLSMVHYRHAMQFVCCVYLRLSKRPLIVIFKRIWPL